MDNNQQWINWTVEIKFKSPFHIGSGLSQGKLIDNLILTDSDGLPYVPGSSLKGRIKAYFNRVLNTISAAEESIETLDQQPYLSCESQDKICKEKLTADNCVTCRIFGSGFTPGSLVFSDCKLANQDLVDFIGNNGGVEEFKEHLTPVRNGNRINRRLQTTEPGALFNYQFANYQYKYQGQITGQVQATDEELNTFKNSIELITHLGGKNSQGLGRCEISIREEE
ncbi:MAG: RAMP superfamily CRISPR-associated protein [Bacillota bacterium]